jgi:hypothetical protein
MAFQSVKRGASEDQKAVASAEPGFRWERSLGVFG